MILTFKKKLKEIENGTKVTTIRLPGPNLRKLWDKLGKYEKVPSEETCYLWWLNPRNQHPDCHRIGTTPLHGLAKTKGRFLTLEQARKDGFDTLEELIDTLAEVNGILRDEVLELEWIIIEWDPKKLELEPLDKPKCLKEFTTGFAHAIIRKNPRR